jgi:hypothetical protein
MQVKIPAADFAAEHGMPETAVVHRIKAGIYDGIEEDGTWYVLRRSTAASTSLDAPASGRESAEPVATEKVARYTSRAYVNSILLFIGGLLLADVGMLVFGGEREAISGSGVRIFVFVLLWTRHRWARLAVQVWACFLVVGSAASLYFLLSADPEEYTVAWWGPLLFGSFVVIGLGYLLTAHRYIKVEEVPA